MREYILVEREVGNKELEARVQIELPDTTTGLIDLFGAAYIRDTIWDDVLETIRRNIGKALVGGVKQAWQMSPEQIQEFYNDPDNFVRDPVAVARASAQREQVQARLAKNQERQARLEEQLAEALGVGDLLRDTPEEDDGMVKGEPVPADGEGEED